jgi:hypothetical protein
MEQKPRSFEVALKKGEIGELIVQDWLEKRGWIVYRPFTKNKAHYFDIMATKNKEKAIAIDVKTKARLNNWKAQGINIRTYNEYKRFINKVNIPFYLIFVDDKSGDVYSAELSKLKNSFNPVNYIIAWYLKDMLYLFNIGEVKIHELSKYDQRNYNYNPSLL